MNANFWRRVAVTIEADTGQSLKDLNVENYSAEVNFDRDNITLFKAIAEASDPWISELKANASTASIWADKEGDAAF
jgi:hypothetical protein